MLNFLKLQSGQYNHYATGAIAPRNRRRSILDAPLLRANSLGTHSLGTSLLGTSLLGISILGASIGIQASVAKSLAQVTPAPVSETAPILPNPSSSEITTPHLPDNLDQVELPPQPLLNMVRRIDQAASSENLRGVMRFYDPNLQHGDGITADDLEDMLTDFWEEYDNLNYVTQITEWQAKDTGFTTTTITTVTGQRAFGAQTLHFEAVLEARQVIRDRQIVAQEIVSESSQIQLGQAPPTVDVNLPDEVGIGQPFFFDAIVLEPIGDSLLMGTAFSDPVSLENYRMIPALDVAVLGAGGLFKMGDAPSSPGQEWVSGLILREDGITGITQRLKVVNLSDL